MRPESASSAQQGQWCEPDGCPASICGGPHYEVKTSIGVEILRADQEPIGALPTSAVSAACWCGGGTHQDDDGTVWCYEDINHDPRPAEISGSTLCSQQPCEWYTSDPSGVCGGCRRDAQAGAS